MHLLLIAVIIILLIVIILKLNKSQASSDNVRTDIYNLKKELNSINESIAKLQQHEKVAPATGITKEPTAPLQPVEIVQPEPEFILPKENIIVEKVEEPVMEIPHEQFVSPEINLENKYAKAPADKPGWFQQWLTNNPDIEKFIGENLINKIGIAVLILGIAFFVKYAIDQEWINEVGRVCIGLFCGIILIALAHRLRLNYRSFSSVLVGGGLSVFYFTIAFAFHQYHLIGQAPAFVIMVIITAFAVILSILYNRIELAILATIGGFITPFLVSTGEGNYIVLFTYLCILNGGLIVLSFYKRWHALHFIAFGFTALIYGAWIFSNHTTKTFSYPGTFLFGTIFYFMFLIMNILLYVKKEIKLVFSDAALTLIINLGYYGAGIFLLDQWQPVYKGMFTALLGVINLALAIFLFKQKKIDRNFIYLLIGITLTFISLAAPVQLEGNYITIFWAAETVLLLWLYQKSFIRLFKTAFTLLTILTLLSLWIDWVEIYAFHSSIMPVIVNKGFITTIFCGAAMAAMFVLMRKEADLFFMWKITNNAVRLFYLVAAVLLFFNAGIFEISRQFSSRYTTTDLQYIYLLFYISAFVLVLIRVLSSLKITTGYYMQLAIACVPVAYYIFTIYNTYFTEQVLLQTSALKLHFLAHWAGAILLLIVIFQLIQQTRLQQLSVKKILPLFTWLTAIFIILFFSVEVKDIYIWIVYKNPDSFTYAENLYNKAGLSIVWGLLSFAFIWLGMHYGFKTLRIIALMLFGITLLKLFVFDLKNIPPGGKIIAFILLGVLLLTVSFMYQRLKKLIIDDATTKK